MNRCAAQLWASLLTVSMLLSLAACGGNDTAATTMRLQRTEGTVAVSDDDGKDVPLLDNLGLYSGYGVDTRSESYAWINLDDVKLAKMDQGSGIAIQKAGKALEIEVRSGSLFFNVTQPLEDDETMDIRTSTMLVGIRGTCGWVEDRDGTSRVYLLEGRVECSAGDQTVQVKAGEMAEFTAGGKLTVTAMTVQDIPTFVQDDLSRDPELCSAIDEASGLDVTGSLAISDTSDASGTSGGTEEDMEASGGTDGDITWVYNDGVLTISGTGSMEDYSGGQAPWSDYRKQIHTVIIGNGITRIGNVAFSGYSSLTNVTIPDSVTSIGRSAFAQCSSLASVAIPDSVTSIEVNAFAQCSSLTSVTIPDSVTSIGGNVFRECSGLTDVTIPDSVTSIGGAAFWGCSSLTSVSISAGINIIENNTFENCSSLASVSIPDGVATIGMNVFSGCSSLTSVSIPDSVTFIGIAAFSDCSNLTDVYYGGSVGQWGQVDVGPSNGPLLDAAIHYQ